MFRLLSPFFCEKKVVEVKGADDTLTRISSNFKLVAAPENLKTLKTFIQKLKTKFKIWNF